MHSIFSDGEFAAKKFYGDRHLAQLYLPLAAQLLGYLKTQNESSGIGYSVRNYTHPDGAEIRVIRNGDQNIVIIDVRGVEKTSGRFVPFFGYQFWTTTPNLQRISSAISWMPGGSVVWVPPPMLIPPKNYMSDNPDDFKHEAVDFAIPRGSVVDSPPKKKDWPYVPMPSSSAQLVITMSSFIPVKATYQVDGNLITSSNWNKRDVTTHANRHLSGITPSFGELGLLDETPNYYDNYQWAFLNTRHTGHVWVDAEKKEELQTTHKKCSPKVPDADWHGAATTIRLNTKAAGVITFVVMVDMSGTWHCWVKDAQAGPWMQNSKYASQGHGFNLPEQFHYQSRPNYPEWAHFCEGLRDKKIEEALYLTLEPQYKWTFTNTDEVVEEGEDVLRAIAAVIERKETEAEFWRIEYLSEYDLYTQLYEYDEYGNSQILCDPPTCERIDPFEIYPQQNRLLNNIGKSSPIKNDYMGIIEVEFAITASVNKDPTTGAITYNVDFKAKLSDLIMRPDEIHELEYGTLVDVAYIRSLPWEGRHREKVHELFKGYTFDGSEFGGMISPGDRQKRKMYQPNMPYPLGGDSTKISSLRANDVVGLFVEAYRHKDQEELLKAYDGEFTVPQPAKAFASIRIVRRAPTGGQPPPFHGSGMQEIIRLPIIQDYGIGYATVHPHVMQGWVPQFPGDTPPAPGEPHLKVNLTDHTIKSHYPFAPEEEEGCDPWIWRYRAKITDVDLSSLAYYYHVRVVGHRRSEKPLSNVDLANDFLFQAPRYQWKVTPISWYPIEYKSASWCAVVAMGYVVDEVKVGNEDVPIEPWVLGWVENCVSDKDVETLIDPDEIRNFRGIGAANMGYRLMPLFDTYYQYRDPFIKRAWVNSAHPSDVKSGKELSPAMFLQCFPWWMVGACRTVVETVLYSFLSKTQVKEITVRDRYKFITAKVNSAIPKIKEEPTSIEDMKEIAHIIFNYSDSYSVLYTTEWQTGGEYGPHNPEPSYPANISLAMLCRYDVGEKGVYHVVYKATTFHTQVSPFKANPFTAACPWVDEDTFVEQAAPFLWKYWCLLKDIVYYYDSTYKINAFGMVGCDPPVNNEQVIDCVFNAGDDKVMPIEMMWPFASYYTAAFVSHLFTITLPPPQDYIGLNYSRLLGDCTKKTGRDIYKDSYLSPVILRNFECGNLTYTHVIRTCFSPVINNYKSSIVVSPKGHVSYYKSDVFDIKHVVKPEVINYINRKEEFIELCYKPWEEQGPLSGENACASILLQYGWRGSRCDDAEMTAEELIDWKLLEGVRWYCGIHKQSHVDLYNKAYKQGATAEDFRPHFEFKESKDGDMFPHLFVQYSNEFSTIGIEWHQLIMPWGVRHLAPYQQEAWLQKSEIMDKTKHIRLNPAFF